MSRWQRVCLTIDCPDDQSFGDRNFWFPRVVIPENVPNTGPIRDCRRRKMIEKKTELVFRGFNFEHCSCICFVENVTRETLRTYKHVCLVWHEIRSDDCFFLCNNHNLLTDYWEKIFLTRERRLPPTCFKIYFKLSLPPFCRSKNYIFTWKLICSIAIISKSFTDLSKEMATNCFIAFNTLTIVLHDLFSSVHAQATSVCVKYIFVTI